VLLGGNTYTKIMKISQEEKILLKAFGEHLADVRKFRGFTQKELSARSEVSEAAIASMETGRRWPHLNTLHKVSIGLDMSLYDFFSGIEWPEGYKGVNLGPLFAP
jgi:transcriptional regulator with XRE-family HTH domain